MAEERYECPDVDCGYTSDHDGECMECGHKLRRIPGEAYFRETENDPVETFGIPEPELLDDDPSDISWGSEGMNLS